MGRKLSQPKLLRLSLCLCLLAWASWGPRPASAGTSGTTGQLPELPAVTQPVPAQPEAVATFNFTVIAAGGNHTCGLLSGCGMKCWGSNVVGQLGDGTRTDRNTPVDVSGLAGGVTAIAAGESYTCVLMVGGGVECWGSNHYGQLGDGTLVDSNTPVNVTGLASGVTAIAASGYHTCALLSSGGVKCWGDNESGQLGDGTLTGRSTPVAVSGLSSGVSAVAAGWDHTCALLSGGGVKCWGYNGEGQLGDGTLTQRSKPVKVLGLASGVTAIAAGASHSCALASGGGVKCWGYNLNGQLGDATFTDRSTPMDVVGLASGVMDISAGALHTCALVSGGGVKCWGANQLGQLGNGILMKSSSTPVDVVGLANGVLALSAGGFHNCTLVSIDIVKCWGSNNQGQLGDGMLAQRSLPVDVAGMSGGMTAVTAGGNHTCELTSGGGVKCWGENAQGQLGDDTLTDRSTPVDVVGLSSNVTAIAAGYIHTCALDSNGGVKCWGLNIKGQLGDGTQVQHSTPVDVSGMASGMTAIAVGFSHTCALDSNSNVKCWGYNYYGQLGNGTQTDQSTPVDVSGLTSNVTAIVAGYAHTCALISDGGVKCWGDNEYGQLGNGTTTNSPTPVDVVDLTMKVTAITAGAGHTCALLSSGGVKCWGANYYGQLGDGTLEQRSKPVHVIGLVSGVTALTAGGLFYLGHTCALLSGGGVKCWGENEYGQLGDGTFEQRTTPVDVVGLANSVTAIAAGWDHTCALAGAGRPKCWGADIYGQLGIGTTSIANGSTPVDVVTGPYLTINYPIGQPGSFFTITGWNFPIDTLATLSINGQVITTTLAVNPTGSFIFFLDTSSAEPGVYAVTVSGKPGATTSFRLANEAPLRSQEGGGQVLIVPNGIALDNFIYLPLSMR